MVEQIWDVPLQALRLVFLSHRVHLYPFRTQKLSCAEPKILAWRRAGKIGQCQHFFRLKFVKIAGREQKTVYSPLNIPLSPLLFLTLYIHSIGSDIPNRKRYLWSNLLILHFALCILHLIYSSIAQSVDEQRKRLIIVLWSEVTKTRSIEAECIEAREATMF